ncbi:MAG: hypothetical protein FJ109_10020 [Deltaproteobacteria bacterium]|nr:hypothetical protein [Deltaproteobacteria bacterium]
MRRILLSMLVGALVSVVGNPVRAEPILQEGNYPGLDAEMARQGKQFYRLNALPFGLSLNFHPKDAQSVQVIDGFLAQDKSEDFLKVTGKHPYELAISYGEHGDLGFFGGIAVAATAYEYRVRKRDGAPPEALAECRARLVRAAQSWHLFKVVTGGGGLVARGIQKLKSEPGEPPMPVDPSATVPLFDEAGKPLPDPKDNGTWRDDNSGGVLPEGEWNWVDSASKDQTVGQVFAMAALYDAMKDDPDIDQGLVAELEQDALLLGKMLMEKREVSTWPKQIAGKGLYDLIIMDADGRPTYHHDLKGLSLEKFYFTQEEGGYNVFNMFMAMGVLKALHHISGDPELEAFFYRDFLHDRGYLDKAAEWPDDPKAIDYIYAGTMTNFDNPDMTGVALFLALYLENDPEVTEVLRRFLEIGWWQRNKESHTARNCKQPLWHALYLAGTAEGTDPALVSELATLLEAFPLGPYWNNAVINCDAQELAGGECLAVDGKTVLKLSTKPKDGDAMATEALDPSIRPPSDFNARSNPFEVNGGGGLRLNPGGDLQAAYWLARYFESLEPGEAHLSPFARDHMPVGGWPEPPAEGEGDVSLADAGDDVTADAASDLTRDGTAGPDSAAPGPELTTSDDNGAADASSGKRGSNGCSGGPVSGNAAAAGLILALLVLAVGMRRRGRGWAGQEGGGRSGDGTLAVCCSWPEAESAGTVKLLPPETSPDPRALPTPPCGQ